MKHLLRLYPCRWRRRYGPEMEAVLEEMPFGWREAGDLVRGALDAYLHPQWRPHSGRLSIRPVPGLALAALWAAAALPGRLCQQAVPCPLLLPAGLEVRG
jgi:hypothetical protein